MGSQIKLIDEIMLEVLNKNLLGDVRILQITNSAYEQLLSDFKEEFEIEYMDMGRDPSFSDLQDHFNLKILITEFEENGSNSAEEKRYELLKKVE